MRRRRCLLAITIVGLALLFAGVAVVVAKVVAVKVLEQCQWWQWQYY